MTTSAKKSAPLKAAKTGQLMTGVAGPAHLDGGATVKSDGAKYETTAFAGSAAQVIDDMRRGIPANVIPGLASRLGVSQDSLFVALRLPPSTMKGRISKNQPLSASEQDRMYRADRVWWRAVEVLEDEGAARAWINRSNRSLGGEAPLTLLDTEVGYELVLDTLGRIEYGVVS